MGKTRTAPWDYSGELADRLETRDIEDDCIRRLCGDAMAELRELDPTGWEAWFDDNGNVPASASIADVSPLVEGRCAVLRGEYDQVVEDLYWETGDPDEAEVEDTRRWLREESVYDTRLLVGV